MNVCERETAYTLPQIGYKELKIPCCGIGTYLRTEPELHSLFACGGPRVLVVDTAHRYGNEGIVGRAIRQSGRTRDDFFLTGKLSRSQQEVGDIEHALKSTLKNLGTRYLDLYLIHSPRHPDYVKNWKTMLECKSKGFVCHLGVSNFNKDQMAQLFQESGVYPVLNQLVPNHMDESTWEDTLTFCESHDIIVQIAAPFGGADSGRTLAQPYSETLWKLYRMGFASVFGTHTKKHMQENLSVFALKS